MNADAPRILIADDDDDARRLVERYLTVKGFRVLTAPDGSEACRRFFADEPDLVLLDVNMPEQDGWSVLEEIRSAAPVPVIMLTVLDSARDKVRGLTAGADDYITKPFDLKELEARIRAVLRRTTAERPGKVHSVGDLTIDDKAKEVRFRDRVICLSPKEYELLRLLASEPGRVFSTREILRAVWPERVDESGPEDVKKYVYYLRNKLRELPPPRPVIRTVRGFGYRLDDET